MAFSNVNSFHCCKPWVQQTSGLLLRCRRISYLLKSLGYVSKTITESDAEMEKTTAIASLSKFWEIKYLTSCESFSITFFCVTIMSCNWFWTKTWLGKRVVSVIVDILSMSWISTRGIIVSGKEIFNSSYIGNPNNPVVILRFATSNSDSG